MLYILHQKKKEYVIYTTLISGIGDFHVVFVNNTLISEWIIQWINDIKMKQIHEFNLINEATILD